MWNKLKRPLQAVLLLAVVGLCIWAILPIQQKIHLGLDLQGGARLLLELQPTNEVPTITTDVQNQVETVVQRRVNVLGVAEPVISKVGSNRLLVELPAVKNADEAERLLKEAAVLEFKIVLPQVSARARSDKKYAENTSGAYKDSGPVVYSGAELKSAAAAYGQAGEPQVQFQTKNATKFGKLTSDNMGKLLGIFLDKKWVSDATIEGVITSDGMIHGSFTEEDVTRLANELNAGALPVPTKIIEKDDVGPILGKEDLQKSLYASMVGLALVLIFMGVVYRLPGVLADLALVVYILALLALLAEAKAVLTLPGIAGFVLSIGMAVDANVLIFERIKEELWAGKTLRAAVSIGFQARSARSSIATSPRSWVPASCFCSARQVRSGLRHTPCSGAPPSRCSRPCSSRFFMDVIVENNVATSPKVYGA